MPGISIHVVDVSRGIVAAGMLVELFAVHDQQQPRLIASATISKTGVLASPELDRSFEPGYYEALFHIADFYRRNGSSPPPAIPFLDVVSYRFGIADPEAHYHLPMKCTPWGYSCFRGGA